VETSAEISGLYKSLAT